MLFGYDSQSLGKDFMMRVFIGVAYDDTLLCWGSAVPSIVAKPSDARDDLTAITDTRVGHYTLGTPPPDVPSKQIPSRRDVRGATPDIPETTLLNPANATTDAILRSVRAATDLSGYPSVEDLQGDEH
jgi:hypothetical protein